MRLKCRETSIRVRLRIRVRVRIGVRSRVRLGVRSRVRVMPMSAFKGAAVHNEVGS